MPRMKFTVFLLPDESSYQVIFPYDPSIITCGNTIEEALRNAQEALELTLECEAEGGADPLLPNVRADRVVVAEIEAEVPESLLPVTEEPTGGSKHVTAD